MYVPSLSSPPPPHPIPRSSQSQAELPALDSGSPLALLHRLCVSVKATLLICPTPCVSTDPFTVLQTDFPIRRGEWLSSEPTTSHDRHTHLPSLTQQLAGAVAITSSLRCLITQFCPTLHDPMGCSQPRSSAHGISRARILEWVAISFSGGSS